MLYLGEMEDQEVPNNDGTNIVGSTCFLLMLSSAIRWKPLSFPLHRSGN